MKCRECYVWKQHHDQSGQRAQNLTIETARWLGKRQPSESLNRSVDASCDWLDRKWRYLVSIMNEDCSEPCRLIGGEFFQNVRVMRGNQVNPLVDVGATDRRLCCIVPHVNDNAVQRNTTVLPEVD